MGRVLAVIAAGLLMSPGQAASVTRVPLNTFVAWDSGAEASYAASGITLTFVPRSGQPEKTAATLNLRGPRGERFVLPFDSGLEGPSAQFAVGTLDPANPIKQVLLATYSGGAHCCTGRTVIELVDGHWKVLELPAGGEQDAAEFPKDENKDGVPDFVLSDDRFAYAFACFACSWMPPRIFDVKDGALIELSASRRFDRIYEEDMATAKAECLKPEEGGSPNGYCAGYAADAARLGQFLSAWPTVLAHYQKNDDWDYPEGCKNDAPKCARKDEVHFKFYPEALARFLFRTGYISADDVHWALR